MIDPTSPPTKKLKQLIFGGPATNQDTIEEDLDEFEAELSKGGNARPSAYVSVFEEMVRTVSKAEGHLLSAQDTDMLEKFSQLSYNSRYCLVRLALRKPDQWHPVSALNKYGREIGDDFILPAITTLCKPIKEIMQAPSDETKTEATQDIPPQVEDEREIIDLTMDSDDEDVKPIIKPDIAPMGSGFNGEASTSRLSEIKSEDRLKALLEPLEADTEFDCFCEDESVMTLNEVLNRLKVDQLKALGVEMNEKFKGATTKSDMIYKLQLNAATQSVLGYVAAPTRKGKGKSDGLVQSRLPFKISRRVSFHNKTNQEDHLKTRALRLLGKCIRVRYEFYRLVRRLHIICFRETEHPTALLLPALLTTFKKRDYTSYSCTRSNNVWSSRQELSEYERALELESLLDELIEEPEDKPRRKTTKTPSAAVKNKLATPGTSAIGTPSAPLRTPRKLSNHRISTTPGNVREAGRTMEDVDVDEADIEGSLEPEISKEEKIKRHLETWIYPKWQELLAKQKQRSDDTQSKPPGLERFESGHVYTRMLHKATKALGTLKEYNLELKIINDLLNQTFWRRGKRSAWYERRAIILGHLTRQAVSKEAKQELVLETLEGVKQALRDEDTNLICRPGLVKRLLSLEIKLGVSVQERSRSDGKLQPAPETTLRAVRVDPSHFDAQGKENEKGGLHSYISITESASTNLKKEVLPSKKKIGHKSRWKGKNDQTVSVETRALEHYEEQGFKGFHCETKILTTIFALLFWDIIFAEVPGAFETSYQVAPLDMFDETFKNARKDLIFARLEEIRNGHWRSIAERHDSAYREKKTWCIGVSWDLCNKEDFLDILECFGGKSLATICQHFCEDYKGRSSGGPDLFIWKPRDGDQPGCCKFVEVKGPGDHPQANQRVWFDCLHRSNVAVEICWVIDINQPPKVVPASKKRKNKADGTTAHRKKNPHSGSISDEEDYDLLDPEPEEDPLPISPTKRRRITPARNKIG